MSVLSACTPKIGPSVLRLCVCDFVIGQHAPEMGQSALALCVRGFGVCNVINYWEWADLYLGFVHKLKI